MAGLFFDRVAPSEKSALLEIQKLRGVSEILMQRKHFSTNILGYASTAWSLSCIATGVAIVAMLPSSPVAAQCAPPPDAVNISSGSCVDPAFTERTSAGSVVVVSGAGSYSATSTHLEVTGSGYGAYATGGGTITLTGAQESADTLAQITTSGVASHALYANGGGLINGDNMVVYTNDSGSFAVYADNGGKIFLSDVNTYSNGSYNSSGAVASGTGSSVVLTNTYVNVLSNNGAGLQAVGGGHIIVDGGAVVTGDYHGVTTISTAPGIMASGAGSKIEVRNGASSATYGANSPGVWAEAGARIDFSGYGIFTYQPDSPGAQANGDSIITLSGAIVRTSGPSSAALHVDAGGAVVVTDSEVTSGYRPSSANTPVLQFPEEAIGLEAHGSDVIGTGSRLEANNTRITTTGDGAVGVWAREGATAVINGGRISTSGASTAAIGGADGARATDADSSIALHAAMVTTSNDAAVGLHALGGGGITAEDATVVTQGRRASGVQAEGGGSVITLRRTSITTSGDSADGARTIGAGSVQLIGGSVDVSGHGAHGVAAIDGGVFAASGASIAASGAESAAIYLGGGDPGAPNVVSVTGGSLRAAHEAIVLADGGTGAVSISGATISPSVVNGRLLLAHATENASGTPANLTLNINDVTGLAGDIIADSSTLTFNLGRSDWTGDLALTGRGSAATANLSASQWTGDLLADVDSSADVALAQGSQWTGRAVNATNIAVDASSAWNVTGDSNATGTLTNGGLVQFLPRSGAYTTLTVGNYTGNGGRIGFNTYLGNDSSPSNLLVINGGVATGSTTLLVANTGGPGALTTADGIRLVQVTNGGATESNAFTLGQRVAAGSYEYRLFRGGSTSADDWFLRSHLTTQPTDGPDTPPGTERTEIPLYRPEAALYAPIPAIGRQMGLVTLGTLHERVGEEENLRGGPESRAYANGAWARAFGQRVNNRWHGTVGSRADGDLAGLQSGFDLLRRTSEGGNRDHVGVYVAYTDYSSSSMRGFAFGTPNLPVGRLSMRGPSVGAYWTHFGPSGWYTDAVFQASWYDISASSNYGAGISTKATGYTASLETGYPVRFGEGGRWQVEPQAQIIWQGISIDRTRDLYSPVGWNPENAWTGRLGLRLQYTEQDARGTVWQPYARVNLWRAFDGSDRTTFGTGSPIISNFGNTALEIGGGLTARVNANMSLFGQASYRLSLDASRSQQSAIQGTVGVRLNW